MEAVDISDLIVKKLGFLYKLCEALKFYAKGIKVALFMSSVIYDQNCARKKETKKKQQQQWDCVMLLATKCYISIFTM